MKNSLNKIKKVRSWLISSERQLYDQMLVHIKVHYSVETSDCREQHDIHKDCQDVNEQIT
jgi:hypothetical protein